MLNLESFEEELYRRFKSERENFTGNRTKTRYRIQQNGTRKNGFSLFANDKPIRTRTSFFSIACKIWDRETKGGNVYDKERT